MFFLGPALLVVPVYFPGASELMVDLPGASDVIFQHLWSNQTYQGGMTITVPARYGKPPIFVRRPLDETLAVQLVDLFQFARDEKDTILTI